MSEAYKIKPLNVWGILDSEGYIKKSIRDGSLAVFEENSEASSLVKGVSMANNEECFVEEIALCNKEKLDSYIETHEDMYEELQEVSNWLNSQLGMGDWHKDIEKLLAKARGDL